MKLSVNTNTLIDYYILTYSQISLKLLVLAMSLALCGYMCCLVTVIRIPSYVLDCDALFHLVMSVSFFPSVISISSCRAKATTVSRVIHICSLVGAVCVVCVLWGRATMRTVYALTRPAERYGLETGRVSQVIVTNTVSLFLSLVLAVCFLYRDSLLTQCCYTPPGTSSPEHETADDDENSEVRPLGVSQSITYGSAAPPSHSRLLRLHEVGDRVLCRSGRGRGRRWYRATVAAVHVPQDGITGVYDVVYADGEIERFKSPLDVCVGNRETTGGDSVSSGLFLAEGPGRVSMWLRAVYVHMALSVFTICLLSASYINSMSPQDTLAYTTRVFLGCYFSLAFCYLTTIAVVILAVFRDVGVVMTGVFKSSQSCTKLALGVIESIVGVPMQPQLSSTKSVEMFIL